MSAKSLGLSFLAACLLALSAVSAGAQLLSGHDLPAYEGLPQGFSPAGYPQLGYPTAPVPVIIYLAFDDEASAAFHRNSFPMLIERGRAGEAFITVLPVVAGGMNNGRGAARAALCAAEQGAFFAYADLLFESLAARGTEAFAGTRLIEHAQTLALDRQAWDGCMISDRPDRVLQAAEAEKNALDIYTQTPFVMVGDNASLTDPNSLNFTIDLTLQRIQEAFERALNAPTAVPDPEATEPPETITVSPLLGGETPRPPLEIDLPSGWQAGYNTLLLQDIDAPRPVPFAVYTGPVTGGTGTIVLLWGFPNLVLGAALPSETVTPDLWMDGTRLLRLAILEEGCNIGTDLRMQYSVGGLAAIGTQFAAVDCPELADTRGWFAGLRQFNLNFIFYVFTEPIEAMDVADDELQTILDTVRFLPIPIPTPTPQAEATEAP